MFFEILIPTETTMSKTTKTNNMQDEETLFSLRFHTLGQWAEQIGITCLRAYLYIVLIAEAKLCYTNNSAKSV